MRRRFISIRRRFAIVIALAAVGALALPGTALGAGSSNVSYFSFLPSNPHGVLTSGRLIFGTNTVYSSLTSTSRIQLQFDDDIHFNPNAFPKCDPADLSGNLTMQQALQACGPAAGAANNAWLRPPTAALSNGTALFELGNPMAPTPTACVLVFNGSGDTSEVLLFFRIAAEEVILCESPPTNTAGETSFLVQGDLRANPGAGGDYADPDNCSAPDPRRGCQIDLSNVSNGPMRLRQFSVRVMRGKYVRAKCVDPPAGNRQWNLRAVFTYAVPTATQTATKSQTCT